MNVIISNSSPDPIYEQIEKQIRKQIIAGELAEGESLPSIRKLAMDLQISVITTKRAYDDLTQEGYIDTVPGKGCFVAAQNKELLRERKMKIIEEKLEEAVSAAKMLGVTRKELQRMLVLLYEEEL
jgi:GntR family transcriptional regulator